MQTFFRQFIRSITFLLILTASVFFVYGNVGKLYSSNFVPTSSHPLLWGAYVGDGSTSLSDFEKLVGKNVNLYGDFVGWDETFPSALSQSIGGTGKILVIYWEPNLGLGYDAILSGSEDAYIKQFAADAKTYGYQVILAPFDEMNLNENDWGYGINGNTATKFQEAWIHIHNMFLGVSNVKFAFTFNFVSYPDVSGNQIGDYYPGDSYVDYVGIDGFNFGNPWQSAADIFDPAIKQALNFKKPIFVLSTSTVSGAQKPAWIIDLATELKKYPSIIGWVWFNQNGADGNWLVNTDKTSLDAFKSIIQ